jgi:hypothetical protein
MNDSPPAPPGTNLTAASARPATVAIPDDIRDLFGPPPLTQLESPEAYERLLTAMAAAAAPKDAIEWLGLRDIVDLTWEEARARRAKKACLLLARQRAIAKILEADWEPWGQVGGVMAQQKAIEAFAHKIYRHLAQRGREEQEVDDEPEAAEDDVEAVEMDHFDDVLSRLGLTEAAIEDTAYLLEMENLERLQRLIDNATARREAALREIERRRDTLARRLRDSAAGAEEIINAEFE